MGSIKNLRTVLRTVSFLLRRNETSALARSSTPRQHANGLVLPPKRVRD